MQDKDMAASSSNRKREELVKTVQRMLNDVPQQSDKCCIYRVPKLLHCLNPEAYTPMAFQIGPIHNKDNGQDTSEVNDPELISNRLYKLQFLKSFFEMESVSPEVCTEIVRKQITDIRECYAYSDKIFGNDDIFTDMILMDCIFIIQLFLEHVVGRNSILMAPLKRKEIASDLILAENQLPLFILKELTPYQIIFEDIACDFLDIDSGRVGSAGEPFHLLDMLRMSMVPATMLKRPNNDNDIDLQKIMYPTATGLFEAGIKFRVIDSALLDISFDEKKGILCIPKLRVDVETERKFRNMIAFEQSHYRGYTYITDYQFFMDCLINTPADVQLLTKRGIIENWLGSETNVSELINSMGIHAYHFTGGYLYSEIATELNRYHKKKWNRYKAILNRGYLSHPWAILGLCSAGLLLLLTIAQVVLAGVAL